MKVNNSNWLTNLVSIVGVTSFGLFIGFPSEAQDLQNSQPSIFQQAPYALPTQEKIASYSHTHQLTNPQHIASKQLVAQQNSGSKVLNPRPSIFNEAPYNRSRSSGGVTSPSSPNIPETAPPTGTPITPPPPSGGKPSSSTGSKNLVALAQSSGQFTKLTQALKAAGLVETLQGKGPFTVFAPTDQAFAELPQDALAELFKPENKEVLVKILTYHVVPGQVLSTDLKSGEVKSVEGSPISVKVDGKNGVVVNDAKVTQADLKASNGVIHVIDKVILPPNL